jgi:hypothetical protein
MCSHIESCDGLRDQQDFSRSLLGHMIHRCMPLILRLCALKHNRFTVPLFVPQPRSGSSLIGVKGSTVLGTLSLSNRQRTTMNNAG